MTIPHTFKGDDRVYISNREIYDMIADVKEELSDMKSTELAGLKARVAVLYVTHGITIAGITAMFVERMK